MKSTKTWKVAAASFRVFPLVIADSERDMPGIKPGSPGTTAPKLMHHFPGVEYCFATWGGYETIWIQNQYLFVL